MIRKCLLIDALEVGSTIVLKLSGIVRTLRKVFALARHVPKRHLVFLNLPIWPLNTEGTKCTHFYTYQFLHMFWRFHSNSDLFSRFLTTSSILDCTLVLNTKSNSQLLPSFSSLPTTLQQQKIHNFLHCIGGGGVFTHFFLRSPFYLSFKSSRERGNQHYWKRFVCVWYPFCKNIQIR